MFARFWSTAFKSNTLGWMTCLRLNISNWRVRAAARREAAAISFRPLAVEPSEGPRASRQSAYPWMTVSTLLKSCATPAANCPTDSSFWACRN